MQTLATCIRSGMTSGEIDKVERVRKQLGQHTILLGSLLAKYGPMDGRGKLVNAYALLERAHSELSSYLVDITVIDEANHE